MNKSDSFRNGLGIAFRLGIEMLVATGIGSMMGFSVDHFFNTSPWFLILGVFFGAGAGGLSAYRTALKLEKESLEGDNEHSE